MNNVQLIGNLTQNPELRKTRSERAVATLRLAVPRPRKDGEDQGADFVDVTVFGVHAENCLRYLNKGRRVAVEGHLHYSEWESDNGRRQKLEVVARFVEFLGSPGKPGENEEHSSEPVAVAAGAGARDGAEDSEDIPF
jgi:single-strand DNA-binding protein